MQHFKQAAALVLVGLKLKVMLQGQRTRRFYSVLQ
jgi:hypothetical protein